MTALCLPAFAASQRPCHDLSAVTTIANEAMTQIAGLAGLCVQIDQHGQNLYRQAFGSYTLQQNVPLYSATKPLSAAVLLALADQQLLGLDDPVALYLPEYATPALSAMTLRMCFSHTTGLPDSSWATNTSITLRQAAMNIALISPQFAPGTAFAYANSSMQVAGAVCEVVTNQSWSQLFSQFVATPLGFTATDYTAFGVTNNPRIAGGARSNLQDYGRFLDMLRGGGVWNGLTVLSQAAVDAMLTDYTSQLPTVFSPNPHGAPYGLGMWLDQRDSAGRTTHASSPGFAGFTGWVDRAHDASGVFLVQYSGAITFPYFERFVAAADAALLPIGTACHGASSPACAAPTWLNGGTWPRAGLAGFAVRCDRAPTNGFGVLLLGLAPASVPSPVLDLTLWLPGAPIWTAGLSADANGHAVLSAPLTGIAAGQTFALQSAWLDLGGCGQHGLRASHALAFTVLP